MSIPLRPVALLAAWAVLAPAAPTQHPGLPDAFDAYVARVQKAFAIPGLCVAVVRNGEAVLHKGYGTRNLGKDEPVDGKTLFGIASNSKVFTASALGLLVDEGKVAWDAPVQRYLPAFQLADPYVSRELTVRDLLVHRSGLGLGAGDLLWWPGSTYDRKEIVRRLRHVPLATSFRSTYAYDNVLYLVAGELIEAVSGQTWEQFVAARILQPVGMTHATPSYPEGHANVSGTHAIVDGTLQAVAPDTSSNTNPAGGIHASAEDMARWLQTLLARGRLASGERLFSAAVARELTAQVTPMPIRDPDPVFAELRPNFSGYALGLRVHDYRGRKVITHTGGLPGFVSRVLFVPEAEFGVAVLTNQESRSGVDAIVYHLLDHALGVRVLGEEGTPAASARDWLAIFEQESQRHASEFAEAEAKAANERHGQSVPSLPLAQYAGTYRDRWYGDVMIEPADGRLRIRFVPTPDLEGHLEHWQHDTFVARWNKRELRADAFVTFALTPHGTVEAIKMVAASPAVYFSFDFHHLDLRPVSRR